MKKRKKFKKKLVDFVKDESGNISKEKVLKIGLGTVSALGIMAGFASDSVAGHSSSSSHSNAGAPPPVPSTGGTQCVFSHANHASHASHSSY